MALVVCIRSSLYVCCRAMTEQLWYNGAQVTKGNGDAQKQGEGWNQVDLRDSGGRFLDDKK